MTTSFDNIIDLALTTIRDYRIDKLYQTDICAFKQYLDGFIVRGVARFTNCLEDLSYDVMIREFNNNLSNLVQSIIADYTVIEWMTSCTLDVTQFQLHLSNSEFKHFSEAENLKQKRDTLDGLREKVSQLCTDYQIANLSKIPYFNV